MRKTYVFVVIMTLLLMMLVSCEQVYSNNSQQTSKDFFEYVSDRNNWKTLDVFGPETRSSSPNIRIIISSGLVSNVLRTIYTDGNYVFVSGKYGGYSYFPWNSIEDPKGQIKNVIISVDTSGFTAGMVEFAKSPVTGKIYARYWNWILDALGGKILYEDLPDPTNGFYGTHPKERFLIDPFGYFWVGTSEPDNDSPDQNGLYRIKEDFSEKEEVLPEAVWQIYMDSKENIWVITRQGIYKFEKESSGYSSPKMIYDSQKGGMWGEHIVEWNGEIYIVMKNFFDNPFEVSDKEFWLCKFNGESLEKLVDFGSYLDSIYWSGFHNYLRLVNEFVFEGNLYLIRLGNSEVYRYDESSNSFERIRFAYLIGQDDEAVVRKDGHDVLLSVGNIPGISIYNLNGKGEAKYLSQVSTSEWLASNDIHSMFYDKEENKIYLSHLINGYTVIDSFGNTKVEFLKTGNYELDAFLMSTGFFRHNGDLYTSATDWILKKNDETWGIVGRLRTNGEKIYYHNGRIWSFLNKGWTDDGKMGYMDLDTGEVWATDPEEYKSASHIIPMDEKYQIFDIVGADDDTLFIGVGSTRDESKRFPFVLKYSYSSNSIDKISLPSTDTRGIFKFTKDSTGNIYGVSDGKVYVYSKESREWKLLTNIETGNDVRDAIVIGDYLLIISGWNKAYPDLKNDGIEVVDIRDGEHKFIPRNDLGLPGGLNCLSYIEHENSIDLWIGTHNGLAEITIPKSLIEDFETE